MIARILGNDIDIILDVTVSYTNVHPNGVCLVTSDCEIYIDLI